MLGINYLKSLGKPSGMRSDTLEQKESSCAWRSAKQRSIFGSKTMESVFESTNPPRLPVVD
jgi:hypothetical protein